MAACALGTRLTDESFQLELESRLGRATGAFTALAGCRPSVRPSGQGTSRYWRPPASSTASSSSTAASAFASPTSWTLVLLLPACGSDRLVVDCGDPEAAADGGGSEREGRAVQGGGSAWDARAATRTGGGEPSAGREEEGVPLAVEVAELRAGDTRPRGVTPGVGYIGTDLLATVLGVDERRPPDR
jgi:hypothetical protein